MSFFAQKSARRWLLTICILLIAVVAAQSILLLTCYDSTLGLYKQGFPPLLLRLGYLVIAFLAVSGAVYLPLNAVKKQVPDAFARPSKEKSSRLADFFALLSAASIIGTLIMQIIRLNAYDHLSILLTNPSDANQTAHIMLIASLALAIPAAFYFICIYTGKNRLYPAVITLLWVCAYLLRVYFDAGILLMSPIRQLTIVALSASALFLVGELRIARGLSATMMYAVFATLTVLFAGAGGISGLLLTAIGATAVSTETLYYAFQLAFALFALVRVYCVLSPVFDAFDRSFSLPTPSDKEDT